MDNRTIEEIRENETRLITEIKQLEKENQELKELNIAISKGLKKVTAKRNKWRNRYYKVRREMQQSFMTTIDSQQRKKNEFIEYLESGINILKIIFDSEQDEDNRYHVLIRKSLLQRILSEYKEITKSNDEN